MRAVPLNIVIVGHVDHGKSTLIGRLLYETGSLPDGKLEELQASSERRGVPIEWSFVLDALQAERDQAITIDTTRIWFSHGERRYAIIDAPGHRQFIRNMLSGAAEADAAILIVDVLEGVSEQTRRHAFLLGMLGIEQVVVAVNKMDLVDFAAERFEAVASDVVALLASHRLKPAVVVPVAARDGVNLATAGSQTPWYAGPTILEALGACTPPPPADHGPLRLRVQDVYRYDTERIAVGRLESGTLRAGDEVFISPAQTAVRVAAIKRWPHDGPQIARAGESIGITLAQPIFLERGDIVSRQGDAPHSTHRFRATFFWLDDVPPAPFEVVRVRFGATEARATIESVEGTVDSRTLRPLSDGRDAQFAIVELTLRAHALVPLDTRSTHVAGARCVLLRGSDAVAGGIVLETTSPVAHNLTPQAHLVTVAERAERNAHTGAVIWLTGLSASGKSTLAMALERRLFLRGYQVFVLDGDNVRSGLNADLGFSPSDRTENIRRVGEVAALFAGAGIVVVTAFISPFTADREKARAAARGAFHEVYVKADLATCEGRDPKGLYRKARSGEITEFTGITSPYEVPERPELTIDTSMDTETCIEELTRYVMHATASSALAPALS